MLQQVICCIVAGSNIIAHIFHLFTMDQEPVKIPVQCLQTLHDRVDATDSSTIDLDAPLYLDEQNGYLNAQPHEPQSHDDRPTIRDVYESLYVDEQNFYSTAYPRQRQKNWPRLPQSKFLSVSIRI